MPNLNIESTGNIEGFGLVFLEANACGKPVIGGKTGGAEDAVIDGQTGILLDDPRDVEKVSNSIVKLVSDENLAKQMGKSGRERADKYFSWNSMAEKLKQLNKAIVNKVEYLCLK